MPIDLLLLAQLLGPHPARRIPFDDLLAGLDRGVAGGLINVSRDGELELFGYTSTCQFDQKWDLFSLIARGLVIDRRSRRVVATPFPKFFNFGESAIPLPDGPFQASEKIDGSLGIVFHHGGAWRVTTRGRLQSQQGAWASDYLRQHIDVAALEPGTTYLVEIVYRENQIVIPYSFSGLVLLSAYDGDGEELSRPALEGIADASGMRIAASVACESFEQLRQRTAGLTRYEEGFVIRFHNGLRLKLKGEAYCRAHKLICRCTPLSIWEAMQNGEDLESMRKELPEEMRRDFDAIRRILDERISAALGDLRACREKFTSHTDKELGLLLQSLPGELTETQRRFAFAIRKPEFFEKVQRKGELRDRLFRLLRPDGNRLPGYVPSDAMNRFAEEEP